MLNNIKNTIMSGIYISIGAIVYLVIPDKVIASCFFALGIFLVLNYHNMLLTKIIPFFFAKIDYTIKDIFISFVGNSIGSIIIALLICSTRVLETIEDKITDMVNIKLNDNPLSLIIMAIFCGILVAYASLSSKKYKRGSFAQIFYVWLFITAFVLCGFDHIVANVFYFTCYSIINGFTVNIIPAILIVLVGNLLGGTFVGVIEKENLKEIE